MIEENNFFGKTFKIGKASVSLAAIVWFALSVVATIIQIKKGPLSYNNFLIFKGVFEHTLSRQNLYALYPGQYFDCNHYGPVFSVIIAPFALLPDWLGCALWCFANTFILYLAIRKLPLNFTQQNFILLFSAIEMMTATHNTQSNAMVAAWIILALIFVQQKKDFWACMFIMLAFFVKIYGIAALAFFFFSENKAKFILYSIVWAVILFCLPMIISSPEFIIQSYHDWYISLSSKNMENADSVMQNMSAMNIIQKGLGLNISNAAILATAALAMLAPLVQITKWKNYWFQLMYLSALLIAIVIFSSSAESATFIFAICGVAIWYILQGNNSKYAIWVLLFAFVFTSLSTTDLFPKWIKQDFIRPYAIKAVPCLLVWLLAIYQLLTKRVNDASLQYAKEGNDSSSRI